MKFILKADNINAVYETYEYTKELNQTVKVKTTSTTYSDKTTPIGATATKNSSYDYVHYDKEQVGEDYYAFDYYSYGSYSAWSSWSTSSPPSSTSTTDVDSQSKQETVPNSDPPTTQTVYRYRTRTKTAHYAWFRNYKLTKYTHKWNDLKGKEVTGDGTTKWKDGARPGEDGKYTYDSHSGWYTGSRNTSSKQYNAAVYATTDGIWKGNLPAGSYTIYETEADEYYDLEAQVGYELGKDYRNVGGFTIPQNSSSGILSESPKADFEKTVTVTNEQIRGNLEVNKRGAEGEIIDDIDFAIKCTGTKYGNYSGWLTGRNDYLDVSWGSIDSIFRGSDRSYYHTTNGTFQITGLPLGTYEIYEMKSREAYYDAEMQGNMIDGKSRVGIVTISANGTDYYSTAQQNPIVNKFTRGNLRILKRGDGNVGEEDLGLNNIDFAIYCVRTDYGRNGNSANTYSGWLTGETDYTEVELSDISHIFSGNPKENVYTTNSGAFEITGLPTGTYKIYEITSREKYYDTELQENYANEMVELGEVTVVGAKKTFTEKKFNNKKTRGTMNLEKQGEFGEGLDVEVAIEFNGKYLDGKNDYVSVKYSDFVNSLMDEPQSYDLNGVLEITGLPIGEYKILELKNNNDYYDIEGQTNYDTNTKWAEIGTYTVVATADNKAELVVLNNKSTRGNLNLTKLLTLENGSQAGAPNVQFEIKVFDEIQNQTYWLSPNGEDGYYNYAGIEYYDLPRDGGTFVTDDFGNLELICAPIGTYEIYETKTHNIEFALEEQGNYVGDGKTLIATYTIKGAEDEMNIQKEEKMQVKRPKGNLEIVKRGHYANDGVEVFEQLRGVSFIISSTAQDLGGWKTSSQKWVYTRLNDFGEKIIDFTENKYEAERFTTNSEGKVVVEGLYSDLGPYEVEEVENSNSYYSDIIVIENPEVMRNINIRNKTTESISVIDARSSGDLKITKVDSVYSGEDTLRNTLKLAGAKFKIQIIYGQYVDIPSSGMWLGQNLSSQWGQRYLKTGSTYDYGMQPHDLYLVNNIDEAAIFETDENGEFNINRIVNGIYRIWEYETPNGYSLQKQEGYDENVGMALVAEIEVKTLNNNTVRKTIKNQKTVVEVSGKVWEDAPRGKANEYNNLFDGGNSENGENNLGGIKVELIQKTANEHKIIADTITSKEGNYAFSLKGQHAEIYDGKVHISYGNYGYEIQSSNNIYNSKETDPRINYWDLANCYVRFIYDNKGEKDENGYLKVEIDEKGEKHEKYGYVTVNPFQGDDNELVRNSKAQEYTVDRPELEEENLTGTKGNEQGEYRGEAITKPGPDNTLNYYSFNDYQEILDYQSKTVRDKLLPGYYNTQDFTIKDINLGLIGKPDPDFSITEDIAYMKVNFGQYTYKYKYAGEDYTKAIIEALDNTMQGTNVPTVNQQISSKKFTGQIYPSDIAHDVANQNNKNLNVYIVYRIAIHNNTTLNLENNYIEEKMYLERLINTYDSGKYTLNNTLSDVDDDNDQLKRDIGGLWTGENGTVSYDVSKNSQNAFKDGIGPQETKYAYLQFRLNDGPDSFVEHILTKQLDPDKDNLTSASSIATATTFHEFWRKDNVWQQKQGEERAYSNNWENQYDESAYLHKSWRQTRSSSELTMRFDLPEEPRKVSGTVFEDKSIDNTTKLGNGINDEGENTLENVLVEIVEKKDGEPVLLYQVDATQQNGYKTQYASQVVPVGGQYSFEGLIPGYYYIRFTYGDGRVEYKDAGGNTVDKEELGTKVEDADKTAVKPNDYKSTIISSDIKDVMREAIDTTSEDDTEENRRIGQWYKEFTKNYSTATDDIGQRETISNNVYTKGKEASKQVMQAFTPRTYITIEDDEDDDKESTQVDIGTQHNDGAYGVTKHNNEFEEFNFGIISVPETKVQTDKQIVNVEYTSTQGNQLVSANPKNNSSIYLTDLDKSNEGGSGSRYSKIELDSNLIDNAKLTLTYEITIKNESDLSYESVDYFRYGEINAEEEAITVNSLRDFLDEKYDYDKLEIISDIIEKKDNTKIEGSVNQEDGTENIANNGVTTTKKFKNFKGWEALKTGESQTIKYKVYDTLQTAIEDLDFKNDMTIYQMQPGKLNTINLNENRISITPWDESLVEQSTTFVITPSTGEDRSNTNYIAITIALIVLAGGIIFIKKKIIK